MVDAVYHSTEEGKKVERNAGKKFLYAARRKRDEEMIQSVLDWTIHHIPSEDAVVSHNG